MVPHCSCNAAFCQSFRPFVLASNQASTFLRRSQFLRDVSGLIHEIEDYLVLYRLAEFVGMEHH